MDRFVLFRSVFLLFFKWLCLICLYCVCFFFIIFPFNKNKAVSIILCIGVMQKRQNRFGSIVVLMYFVSLFLFIRIFRCGNLFSVLFTNQKRANKQKHIILCMKKETIYIPILYFYIYNIHITYTYTFFIFISLRIHVTCTLCHFLPANPSVSFLFLSLALFLFSDSLYFLLIILFQFRSYLLFSFLSSSFSTFVCDNIQLSLSLSIKYTNWFCQILRQNTSHSNFHADSF